MLNTDLPLRFPWRVGLEGLRELPGSIDFTSPRTHTVISVNRNNPTFAFRVTTAGLGEERIAVYSFTRCQLNNTAANIFKGMANSIFTIWTSYVLAGFQQCTKPSCVLHLASGAMFSLLGVSHFFCCLAFRAIHSQELFRIETIGRNTSPCWELSANFLSNQNSAHTSISSRHATPAQQPNKGATEPSMTRARLLLLGFSNLLSRGFTVQFSFVLFAVQLCRILTSAYMPTFCFSSKISSTNQSRLIDIVCWHVLVY